MDNNTKSCSGDCLTCSPQQRNYCAAQHSRECFVILSEIRDLLKSERNRDEGVFNPIADEENE